MYLTEKEKGEVKQADVSDPTYKRIMDEKNNEWLVETVNRYVGKKDRLYILGDVSLGNRKASERFLDRLNGNKHLVLGNHDKSVSHSTRFVEITQIKNFTFSKKDPKMNIHIVLCHFPILSWERKIHGSWHLFGHEHTRPVANQPTMSFDVGIDRIGTWRPYNLWDVVMIMRGKQMGLNEEEILLTIG